MLTAVAAEDFFGQDDEARTERRRRKELARLDECRVLDPWERCRALNDHCDRLLDLTELYDRKTRFALLILSGLNALNLLVLVRADVSGPLKVGSAPMALYVACYALMSLCLVVYAISALRPRTRHASERVRPDGAGVRLTDDTVVQTLDEYCERWREVQIGQVNRELSVIAYRRARVNKDKVKALHRMYLGLYTLVALTAGLFLLLGLARLTGA